MTGSSITLLLQQTAAMFGRRNVGSLIIKNSIDMRSSSSDGGSATKLVDDLLERTSTMVDVHASNIIAYSGGVDSSLVSALVYRVFQQHQQQQHQQQQQQQGIVQAVIGISHAVPQEQIQLARTVASFIGIDLKEIYTTEGSDPTYIANNGLACLACKTHLYTALNAVAHHAATTTTTTFNTTTNPTTPHDNHDNNCDAPSSPIKPRQKVILYNGTNANDVQDTTRVGLQAAQTFHVQSPLRHSTKTMIRQAAKHLNLLNWNYVASPCLRSRLAIGVEATQQHLIMIDKAERLVREILKLDSSTYDLRVRLLVGNRAVIELDHRLLLLSNNSRSNDHDNGSHGGDKSDKETTMETKDQQKDWNQLSKKYNELPWVGSSLKKNDDFDVRLILTTSKTLSNFLLNEMKLNGYDVRPFKTGSVAHKQQQQHQ